MAFLEERIDNLFTDLTNLRTRLLSVDENERVIVNSQIAITSDLIIELCKELRLIEIGMLIFYNKLYLFSPI